MTISSQLPILRQIADDAHGIMNGLDMGLFGSDDVVGLAALAIRQPAFLDLRDALDNLSKHAGTNRQMQRRLLSGIRDHAITSGVRLGRLIGAEFEWSTDWNRPLAAAEVFAEKVLTAWQGGMLEADVAVQVTRALDALRENESDESMRQLGRAVAHARKRLANLAVQSSR